MFQRQTRLKAVWISVFLSRLIIFGNTEEHSDALQCSNGKGFSGISIGIPSALEWKPQAPIRFCVLCKSSNSAESEDFTQELCSNFGDSDRTLVQKFDCGLGREFLHGFTKTNDSLNLMLACSKVSEANVTLLTYESGFPVGQQRNRLARTNWEQMPLDVTCRNKNEIICGLDISKSESSVFPIVNPHCCDVSLSNSVTFVPSDSSMGPSTAAQVWTAILALLVIILAIIVIVLVIQLCCYPICPKECFGNNPDDYLPQSYPRHSLVIGSNKTPSATTNGETRAQFARSTTTIISNNGNGSSIPAKNAIRPSTSSVRPKSNVGPIS
ncbi:hypothetical protein TCAL_12748 [Tigriopus californicus]|uniref:SRCR domain-containing protein n=1 Tax=Tigriopus californicus TaxID=6832 RepID=A0A553NXM8_TIGCA|nr:uncharacterized protein LOC131887405 isoform X2 [Tigriopus californicus]TRY70174.1 hypothetical protein TCAL_12748 [Tigriopus californicus]